MTWTFLPARLLGALSLVLLLCAPVAIAAPPQIAGIAPYGLQRGVGSEVTINGQNLNGNPRLIAPFAFQLAVAPPPGSDAANAKFGITVNPETPIGIYPIRVQTDDGVSNPFLLAIGQLPQIAEKEDNSVPELAQKVETPVVIEGQTAGNDVDFFLFAGVKGQTVLIDAQCARIGSTVDPSIRLTKRDKSYIASAEDSPGLLTDARLVVKLPDDGDYVVEIADSRYQGGAGPIYRLVLGAVPVAEEIYPISGRRGETVGLELRGGTVGGLGCVAASLKPMGVFPKMFVRSKSDGVFDLESIPAVDIHDAVDLREAVVEGLPPVRAALPVVFHGRIDPPGDEDKFTVILTPNQKKIRIDVDAADSGSALDGFLQILGPKGEAIGNADDTALAEGGKKARAAGLVSPDPSLVFDVPAGMTEITLSLKDLAGRGGNGFPYQIKVEPALADFEVVLGEAQVGVPKGGTATLGVTVVRRGWNGPIRLEVPNPPAGLAVRGGTITDGQLVGSITLTTAADAAFGIVNLEVIGKAEGPEGPIWDRASKSVVFAQQGTVPTNSLTQVGVVAAQALELPLSLDAPATPIEVAHGSGVVIPIKASRKAGGEGALAFSFPVAVPGLTVTASSLAEKAGEGTATVNTTADVPLGPVSIGLIGKGKIGPGELTFSLPEVTLNVVRPVAVELAAPSLEIKGGQTIELKGKVVRKPGFAEPVTVKLDALPAGLKAEPVTVTPDKSEFVLKVVADEKAAAATATANLALGFQVAKKDYPFPATPLALKVLPPG